MVINKLVCLFVDRRCLVTQIEYVRAATKHAKNVLGQMIIIVRHAVRDTSFTQGNVFQAQRSALKASMVMIAPISVKFVPQHVKAATGQLRVHACPVLQVASSLNRATLLLHA